MELFFNELSTYLLSKDKFEANEKMIVFSETLSEARKKGFRRLRSYYDAYTILLAENYTLYDWMFDKKFPEKNRYIIQSMITTPFINDADKESEKKYLNANYYFEDLPNHIKKIECFGLAAAFVTESLTISLTSHSLWLNNKLRVIIETLDRESNELVFNIALIKDLKEKDLSLYVESLFKLDLQETTIEPKDKKNHFSDHHGKKELGEFWNKLKKSPYIIEARSTDWGGKKFIRKIENTGIIEIVLINTDKQYSLWIQTTGRTLRETTEIAKLIEEEYN